MLDYVALGILIFAAVVLFYGVIGVIAGSQALVADSLHSLSDLVSDFVVLFAGHHSRKGADSDHPYGHQRFETAASLALGASVRREAKLLVVLQVKLRLALAPVGSLLVVE